MPIVKRKPRKWTPELERELMNMWNYGIHKNEIAERMGMTISAVEGRYHKLKKLKEQADAKAVVAK